MKKNTKFPNIQYLAHLTIYAWMQPVNPPGDL